MLYGSKVGKLTKKFCQLIQEVLMKYLSSIDEYTVIDCTRNDDMKNESNVC